MRAAFVLLVSLSGCYLSHERPLDGSVPGADGSIADGGVTDTADAPDAAVLPPGCRAVCAPPEVLAHVALPGSHDGRAYQFADAATVDDVIVVLTAGRYAGHAPPRDRLLFVDTITGEVRASEVWEASGPFPQHHNGTRILSASREGVTVLALAAIPELEGGFPTGRQRVSVHRLIWNWDGALTSAVRLIEFAESETLGCPGGCEAGIAVDDERALVSYAPDGELFVTEVPLATLEASPWERRGPIGDGEAAPWPHHAAIWEGEHWIAGGGTPDLAEPRQSFLYGPDRTPEPLLGGMNDLPPLLLGGETLVVARHVSGPEGSFHVQRLRPGEPVESIGVRTGPIGALAGWLARDTRERVVLAWSSLAPGTLRDTVVSVTPDIPFAACDEVEPTTVARIPQGIVAPSVLAHPLGETLYVMAFANEPGDDAPQLVVFGLGGCALTE
jgi:hypothetical protein